MLDLVPVCIFKPVKGRRSLSKLSVVLHLICSTPHSWDSPSDSKETSVSIDHCVHGVAIHNLFFCSHHNISSDQLIKSLEVLVTVWICPFSAVKIQKIINLPFFIIHLFLLCAFSPVKFSGGHCWHRSPLVPSGGPGVLQSPQDQAMELSTPEQMDITTSAEASAPLPIRQPAGINLAQMKQQAYPVMAKRPEHLRMNLWPRRHCLGEYISWLFFFSSSHYFFKKQSKKKWMLETMKIQNCTSTHYIYCQNLQFVRAFGTPACYG